MSTETDARPCQDCGAAHTVWFADNALWNEVMGGPTGVVCPTCFIRRAEALGRDKHAWHLAPEETA